MKIKRESQTNKVILLIALILVLTVSSCARPHNRQDNTHEPPEKFEPIPVERPNGFYALTRYSPASDYADIELAVEPAITPKDIKKIRKTTLYFGTWPEIELELTEEGAKKFYLLTRANIGRPIAIVVENHIVSMPMVMAAIAEGRVSIAGGFPEDEIDRIIEILKEEQ